MAELIRIYWRDIPSQVTAKAGRKQSKKMLPDRFQHAIDRAAMRAGKGSSDAYLEDWRRERSACGSDLEAAADAAVEALVAEFDEVRLERIVKAKGLVAGDPATGLSGTGEAATASADRRSDAGQQPTHDEIPGA